MIALVGKKVLITTTNWFTAPDGVDYRAVWGTLRSVTEASKSLGFIPNRAHANWFIEVGKMVIVGCQVQYVIECETVNKDDARCYAIVEGVAKIYDRPTSIFISD